ncbi:GNAT family N-acetyltransferase [Mycetocola zhadangensis]|uniref:N-acetyltransferase n=1 Tax=Mycetocola zhadangensis TaxID=1164595 RepID=A0A3L7J177_9MICO|nr:GNAT family N-acetyltransferase [Mycetocola zhadangensis]RLQ84286.1 N-acetyltransferase [Mycetocola zhadangensis]GGE94390.1 N-acetyltransferase [Mycetocola zhadangensis]
MTSSFSHEPDAKRYALHIGNELVCVADYSPRPGAVYFTHTYTTPSRRGNGHAAALIEFAMNDIESRTDDRVVPVCSFVVDWFAGHPERKNLLNR